MKKVLLGTTALVSAGLLAQQAQAADPIVLSVGGYQNWATYLADNDNNPATGTLPAEPGFNRYDTRVVFDGEIQFKGKTVLDNGLEVGVRFELEGEQQGGDQMDETYAYIEGSFGEFRIGNDDPAAYTMSTAAPYLNYLFAANSPTVFTNGLSQFFSATGRTTVGAGYATFATFPGMSGDDASMMYFTPVFNGFQLGVSYAPDQGEARTGGGYFLGTRVPSGALTGRLNAATAQTFSAGGRYDGEVGELGVTAAAGYTLTTNKSGTLQGNGLGLDDMEAYNLGLVLYYGNWGFGGSYMDVENMRAIANTDTQAYDLGIAYWSDGAWSAGVYWLHQEIDYNPLVAGVPALAAGNTDEFDSYRLMGAYDLGPGISLTGALGWDTFEADQGFPGAATGVDYDSTFVGAGMLVSF